MESQDKLVGLQAWLAGELGLVAPLRVDRIAGGLSNVTSVVEDGAGRRVVVRRPPHGRAGGGAHDVLREARIIAALAGNVPVPAVLGTCADPDVAGWPFYVMAFAPGRVLDSTDAAKEIPKAQRRALGFEFMAVLARLHAADLDRIGLADLRRRTPYAQRQLRRLGEQWRATTDRDVPAMEHVAKRLGELAGRLGPDPAVLVHGDFRFGNAMVQAGPPGGAARITALLDWELTTTGHPLADLGFLAARMQAPKEVLLSDAEPSSVPGYPTLEELAGHYHEHTGVPLADLPFFTALNVWRWAVIVEGIQRRLARGEMGESDENAAWHRRRVEILAEFAESLLTNQ